MKLKALTDKQIYWGIGIAAGLAGIGFLLSRNRKEIVEMADAAGAVSATVTERVKGWIRPVSAKISSPFGYRTHPVNKVKQFHNGIDLPVPVKTEVKCPFPGTVADVYHNASGGNQLTIRHDNGFVTGYAHLSKALVKKGDKVKQGQIIALSGNTGKSTGPHLHLTMKDKAGNWVDPNKAFYANAA